ncbi:MAG: hypothetical protein V1726_03935 [Methanobacteriota archaeon]
MRRMLVVGGSVGAVAIIVLATFPNIISAQSTKTVIKDVISNKQSKNIFNEKLYIFQQIKTIITNANWFPGYILLYLLIRIIGEMILWLISGFYQYY